MTRSLSLLVLVVVGLLAGGCTPPWADQGEPPLSDAAASALRQHTRRIGSAVEAHDWTGALEALSALRTEAEAQATAGEITGQRLVRIQDAAADVERFLEQARATPEPTPVPEPPAPQPTATGGPAPPEPGDDEDGEDGGDDDGGDGGDDGDDEDDGDDDGDDGGDDDGGDDGDDDDGGDGDDRSASLYSGSMPTSR